MAVGATSSTESVLLANLYAAALRYYGTPAHVVELPDPLRALDSGEVTVVPGFTGQLLQTFAPGTRGAGDEQVYKAMVGVLPEGVGAGDFATAAEDKPAAVVTEGTATAWVGGICPSWSSTARRFARVRCAAPSSPRRWGSAGSRHRANWQQR